ncbi:MAG: putative DNA binding domain-containing protein [Verrucomicrobia bacterium]|nr:putative DNA binding domain-containing protein [Verrucomicrobiota bacterium]
MEIEKLLYLPESKVLEFKRDISSLEPILKTVIAFANTAGGTLIIGRSSEGGLVGVKDVFKAEEALASSISDNIRPSIFPDIEIATVEGKDLLIVKVSHWRAPFYLKKEGIPQGVYVRLGTTNRPASPELLAELQRTVLMLSYDQQPLVDVSKDALQLEAAVHRFASLKKESTEEKFRSLGILSAVDRRYVPSVGGLILFGKKEIRSQWVPDARVSCARFLGNDKASILDRLDVEGTILDAVEEVLKFVARNTRMAAEIKNIFRRDIPEYSPVALREALINALVHADYSLSGSHIQIAIFNNRLEIQNPGMFPFGFTLDDFKAGVSRVRNRVIARVFHELKWMEEWGSGYKRIMEACREGGYPQPKWEELGTYIRVTFYPSPQTTLTFRETAESELMNLEVEILSLFEAGQTLAVREIFKKVESRISKRTLQYILAELKRKGYLISKGKGRALVWLRIQ